MRSTRRSEATGGLVALLFLGAAIAIIAFFMRAEPTAPRWRGAGRETPRRGGTFVFHHESDVQGFDPQKSFNELSTIGIKLLFEGLLDYEMQGEQIRLVPRLAVEVPEPSEDGLTYTFRLREGIRFADHRVFPRGRGRPITAHDVRWSLEHMLHPRTSSPGVTFFSLIDGYEEFRTRRASHVRGIRVIDDRTVSIRLTRPDQTFLYSMAMPFAYPVAHEGYERGDVDPAREPVSSGAYVLESWEPGVQVVFRRNRHFFIPGQPYVERMIYLLNLQRTAAVMRFRNGDLDHIHRQTVADYLKLRRMREWAPYRRETPKVNLWGVAMNCELAPFTNRHVRRAVAFAINGPRWRRARAYRLRLTGQPIPRQLMGFDPDLPGQHHYDLRRAREEMRLAGFPNGLPQPVRVWIGEGPTARIYGELLQQDLRAIGIRAELNQLSFPIYLQQTGTRGTAQMSMTGWNMDFPDPSNFLDILFHTHSIHQTDSENRAFYSNPSLDELLDRARSERDPARRTVMYRDASRMIVDDAPWAFIWSDTAMEMWQPYVKNYEPHPVWSNFFRDIWLDLPRARVARWAPRELGTRFALFAPVDHD